MNYKETYYIANQIIRRLILQGNNKIVIYPYGVNGHICEEILLKNYNIKPFMIIDNGICPFNGNVSPIDVLADIEPDEYIVLLTVENPELYDSVRYAIEQYQKNSHIIELFTNMHHPDLRVGWLRNFSRLVNSADMRGSVAECGVDQGKFAKFINLFFCERKCYLFDSFDGFSQRDLDIEESMNFNNAPFIEVAKRPDTFLTNTDIVLSKMEYPENIILRKGFIPETFAGIDDEFCFVHLDMDLYHPTLEALKFFYPRMVEQGVILLHDYYSPYWRLLGVERAVAEYESLETRLCKVPLADNRSIAIIKMM